MINRLWYRFITWLTLPLEYNDYNDYKTEEDDRR